MLTANGRIDTNAPQFRQRRVRGRKRRIERASAAGSVHRHFLIDIDGLVFVQTKHVSKLRLEGGIGIQSPTITSVELLRNRVAIIGVHQAAYATRVEAEIFGEQNVAYLDFIDCARESRSLTIAAALYNGGTVSEPGEPEYVDLREISSGLFSVLRVPIVQGRSFLPEEDRQGAAPVAILGSGFWQRHFTGRGDAVG